MTRAALVIASENQEPFTAAQHAAAAGRLAEYARDVPRSCNGTWLWNPRAMRFELAGHTAGCPWHSPGREEA